MPTDNKFLSDPQFCEFIVQHALHKPIAILVHGSWADGLAKSDSDIDILIPTENTHDSQPIVSPFGKIHIEYCPLSQLQEEVQMLDNEFRHRILDFSFLIARLRNAIILYDPEGCAQHLVGELRAYHPSVMTRRKFYIQAIAFRNDALSAFQEGDWKQALIAGRLAAMSLGAGYLLDHGTLNLNLKWQHHFLERIPSEQEDFFQTYEKVLGLDIPSGAQVARQGMQALLTLFEKYPTIDLNPKPTSASKKNGKST